MSHQCPAPGCETRVPSSMYACRPHWFSLPKEIRDEIWEAYNEEPLSDRHAAAMDAADQYLKEKYRSP